MWRAGLVLVAESLGVAYRVAIEGREEVHQKGESKKNRSRR